MAKSENFNLISQSRSGNNELIFVKLTDSALREIEEFVKNQNKSNLIRNLSIQFSGNEGCLLFPPTASHMQGSKYNFTIADYEGPQGAFECLQQNQGQLEILGTLPHKLRVHANEDVYEATKHRMAVVQENQSNKCTREIKPGSTSDIGRKVRLKSQFPRIPNIPSNSIQQSSTAVVKQAQRDYNSSLSNSILNQSTSTSISSTTASSSLNNNNSNNISISNNNVPTNSTTTAAPTSLNNIISSSHNNSNHINSTYTSSSTTPSLSRLTQGNGSGNSISNRAATTHQPRNRNALDISKRNIKERLIHLLALRPYKKPELYARINGEGVKDREKNCITTVLKQISSMRDNTFHLNRHIWNDVHEDWPFYTEQDRQSLKRRKPQNLTPPLSSDGGSSSTSGQSPTSTHNGSPPPAVKRPALKNDAFDGPVPKKTRVSHYKKEVNHDNIRKGVTDSRDTTNMNPRSRESRELIEDLRPAIYDQYRSRSTNGQTQETEENGLSLSYSVLGSEVAKRITNSSMYVSELPSRDREKAETNGCGNVGLQSIERDTNSHRSNNNSVNNKNHRNNINCTSTRDYERDLSYDRELNGARESTRNLMNVGSIGSNDLSEFTRILSVEQRRKYKTEFDQDYQEYRELHTMMEGVSQKFTMLEDKLRQVSNNERQYRDIQREIVNEYRNNTNNLQFQEKKRKFHYLHQKLSHIKKLVQDFDATLKNNFQQQRSTNSY